ncbi:hypothetical protein BDZ90DRAFT_227476 [Jaminaea rosea]|uniref:Auxin efflux carrier n=1 Tax=Jaminaea rosea TaxID=1569628 RepID=A0A316US40_9BASI|nr:hypothetical protein BDZ90DRAFT_227476 [Jaminaea rosea]PWN26693.1 hypothetical protein BDZ90DRAFT_227476 [Jaminaea rosea]
MGRHLIQQTATVLAGPHGSSGAPIVELIKVTASSILEVVILSSIGYYFARRGIIDKQTQNKINKINVSLFTPALLFSKVAFSLNPRRLAELIIVPAGFVIVSVTSALSAWILSKMFRLSKGQRNFSIACAISPNSNSLPVALMQSLVATVPQLHWEEEGEPEDTVNGMLGRALTYLVLYSTLGMFVRWSLGAKLLSTVEEEEQQEQPQSVLGGQYRDEPGQAEEGGARPRTARLVDYENENGQAPHIRVEEPAEDRGGAPEPLTDGGRPPVPKPSRTRSGPPAWARSFPNTPQGGASPDDSVDGDQEANLATQTRDNAKKVLHRVVIVPAQAVYGFMTPPLWAAVLSLVVALIQPLQRLLDSIDPLVGALENSGACSIPLTMLVLGAYFIEDKKAVKKSMPANSEDPAAQSSEESAGNAQRGRQGSADPWLGGREPEVAAASSSRSSLPWMKNPWSGGSVNGSEYASEYAGSEAGVDSRGETTRSSTAAAVGMSSSSMTKSPEEKAEERKTTMERRTILVSILSRMIVTPLLLIPPMAWYAIATRYNVMDDPVFITSACLIIGSPPALTLAQISQTTSGGNNTLEKLISKTIFVSYAVLAAPTTILLVLAGLLIAEYDH